MAEPEYEDEWAKKDEGSMPGAQVAADAVVAAGEATQAVQADPDFNYDEFGAQPAADAGVAAAKAAQATPEPVKPMSFKETFAARRKAGDAVFEWNGKKYTTDLKKPAAKSATGRAPAGRPAQPQSLTQKMGANFAAAQSAVDNMPHTADGKVSQALTGQRDASLQAYEQAASAEKSGTPGELPSVEIAPGKTILAKGHMPERTK